MSRIKSFFVNCITSTTPSCVPFTPKTFVMPTFDTAHVKNIVLLGHSGSGKTTLAEAMLFEAGLVHKRGSIEEKNTVSDYTDLEKERGNSIYATLLHTQW